MFVVVKIKGSVCLKKVFYVPRISERIRWINSLPRYITVERRDLLAMNFDWLKGGQGPWKRPILKFARSGMAAVVIPCLLNLTEGLQRTVHFHK